MIVNKAFFALQRVHGCFICSGRALAPQEDKQIFCSLSSTDNVPFGDTLRAKATLFIIIACLSINGKRLKAKGAYFL